MRSTSGQCRRARSNRSRARLRRRSSQSLVVVLYSCSVLCGVIGCAVLGALHPALWFEPAWQLCCNGSDAVAAYWKAG